MTGERLTDVKTGELSPVTDEMLAAAWDADASDKQDRCLCGWPDEPCLRKVLDIGPPFPPEPCKPK